MARLSPRIERFAELVGAQARPTAPGEVHLRQHGRIRSDATARWMEMTTRQTIALSHCGFDWLGRVKPLGMVRVRDALTPDGGRLAVSLFGLIPIAGASGSAELTVGELMRYLGELPWAPDAILANPELAFSDLADGSTQVQARGTSLTVRYDADGLISEVWSPGRPASVGKEFVRRPWRGIYSDYRRVGDRLIPWQGNACWIKDGTEFVYGEFGLTDWQLVA
jgi:hypothetical protein